MLVCGITRVEEASQLDSSAAEGEVADVEAKKRETSSHEEGPDSRTTSSTTSPTSSTFGITSSSQLRKERITRRNILILLQNVPGDSRCTIAEFAVDCDDGFDLEKLIQESLGAPPQTSNSESAALPPFILGLWVNGFKSRSKSGQLKRYCDEKGYLTQSLALKNLGDLTAFVKGGNSNSLARKLKTLSGKVVAKKDTINITPPKPDDIRGELLKAGFSLEFMSLHPLFQVKASHQLRIRIR